MLVFLAALQALDPTLEEAARIDGAGPLRRIVRVVVPQLAPVVLFNLVTGTVAAFQVFAQPYVMTEGGPGDSSRFLVLYLYESAFRHLDVGYASALGVVLFVVLGLLVALILLGARGRVPSARRPA
jgi:multiple sugar transport system permease protein